MSQRPAVRLTSWQGPVTGLPGEPDQAVGEADQQVGDDEHHRADADAVAVQKAKVKLLPERVLTAL